MKKLDQMTDTQYIFGALFTVSNQVDTLLEREFKKFDITSKQWFLSIVVDNLFDQPPTIKEVAKQMGSSHQNVKQLALKLESKGLLTLEKDKRDGRATVLILTPKSFNFWGGIQAEGADFTAALFKNIEKEDLSAMRRAMKIMLNNIAEIDYKQKQEGGI